MAKMATLRQPALGGRRALWRKFHSYAVTHSVVNAEPAGVVHRHSGTPTSFDVHNP
jgi:hypothetical protein